MSGNGMKTFSVPQGMDLFFINDRGEQVINPAALPYLKTPLLNKTDPGSKKRKIDEISDSTVFEKMKQEGDEPMPAYPSHVDNDGVICLDSVNSSNTTVPAHSSAQVRSIFPVPTFPDASKENQAPPALQKDSMMEELPIDIIRLLDDLRTRSPTKSLPPLIVPEFAHFKMKVQNMAVRGETNSVSANGKAQKKLGKWKKIEKSELKEVDPRTIDWSEWTPMSFDPDGGTIDGCFGKFSVKPDNTIDRWKKDLDKKKTKLLKMVANPAIAAEGFKNVTVKFLSKSAEPQVHRFEYEQGMLFVRFPKWIQEKLKSLKKTLDFSALPLVKISRKAQITDALERSPLGNLACALLIENFWIFDKTQNTKFEKQLNELYMRFYTEPVPCLELDKVPKGHPVLQHLLIERVSNSTQQSILFQVSNRQMCIQRLCGNSLKLPFEKL